MSAPEADRDVARGRLQLTGRGVALAATALLSLVFAALAGIQELYVVAAASLTLLCAGVVAVARQRLELATSRQVIPGQAVAGESAAVALTVTNGGRRRSPPISLRDPFDGGRHIAAFGLAPLRAGERLTGGYHLPPTPRGRYQVGPLRLSVTDPFGLLRRSMPGAPASPLVVHPRLIHLERAARRLSIDRFGAGGRGAFEPGGEEFAALRPYRAGDDLRHVHWPSTARMDQLMVRQTDAAAEPRATVAVDLRAGIWSPATLDDALAAAGSMLDAARRTGTEVRLLTTPGDAGHSHDTGFGRTSGHWSAVLEALATARSGTAGIHIPLVDLLAPGCGGRGRRGDDTLIVLTSPAATRSDLRGLGRLAPDESLIVIVFGPGLSGPGLSAHGLSGHGLSGHGALPLEPSQAPGRLVQVKELDKLAAAWDRLRPRSDRVEAR